jgi:hypothetical protein
MTLAAAPGPSRAAPADPRRVALADLVGQAAATVRLLARHYAAASQHAEGALRDALEDLARRQETLASEIAPTAAALGVQDAPPPGTMAIPPRWGVVLREAFEAERALESLGRELAVLAEADPLRALGARLAEAGARDRDEVRRLYLRYC